MVSGLSFSKFNVTPEGTVNEDSTIVAQDALDTEAREYPLDPLKVQAVALFAMASLRLGGGVGWGAATGLPRTPEAVARNATKTVVEEKNIMTDG